MENEKDDEYVLNLLDEIFGEDWTIKVVVSDRKDFAYRIVALRFDIEPAILEKTVTILQNKYKRKITKFFKKHRK